MGESVWALPEINVSFNFSVQAANQNKQKILAQPYLCVCGERDRDRERDVIKQITAL